MKILTNIQNLNLNFAGKQLFDETQFQISQGDKIALLGLNGKGKSTLFQILTEDITPDKTEKKFIYDKANLDYGSLDYLLVPQRLNLDYEKKFLIAENYYLNFYPELKSIYGKIFLIEQNPDATDEELMKISDYYQDIDQLNGNTIHNLYLNYLTKFKVDPYGLITEMSGGEQRKIALALGLSSNRNIILWDEPTNHLDIKTIELFEKELINSKQTLLLISHDRELISNLCNKIFHINNFKINSFNGSYYDYLDLLENQEKERQKQLSKLENKFRTELAWVRQGIRARRTRSKKRVDGYNSLKQEITSIKGQKKEEIEIEIKGSSRKTKQLVEIKHLTHGFENKPLYSDLNLKINKGTKLAIVGDNGSGKTTLINLLLDNLQPQEGIIKKAQDLTINYFSQTRGELDPNSTIWDTIGDGRDFIEYDNRELHIASYMSRFLFQSDELKRPIDTFSGGERTRIQLAMFLHKKADIWIFDEPTNDLDLESIGILEETLSKTDITAVIISHDRSFLKNICNKALVLKKHSWQEFEIIDQAIEYYFKDDVPQKQEAAASQDNQVTKSSQKLSYNDKKFLETIEAVIAEKEAKIDAASQELEQCDPTNFKRLDSLNKSLAEMNSELESLFSKWQSLEDI